ncbi:MAG: hypothetical protein QME96_13120, partial [Myxococcota bacterium]|nr:hypothetical protein [Myxococcota bacterium]
MRPVIVAFFVAWLCVGCTDDGDGGDTGAADYSGSEFEDGAEAVGGDTEAEAEGADATEVDDRAASDTLDGPDVPSLTDESPFVPDCTDCGGANRIRRCGALPKTSSARALAAPAVLPADCRVHPPNWGNSGGSHQRLRG